LRVPCLYMVDCKGLWFLQYAKAPTLQVDYLYITLRVDPNAAYHITFPHE